MTLDKTTHTAAASQPAVRSFWLPHANWQQSFVDSHAQATKRAAPITRVRSPAGFADCLLSLYLTLNEDAEPRVGVTLAWRDRPGQPFAPQSLLSFYENDVMDDAWPAGIRRFLAGIRRKPATGGLHRRRAVTGPGRAHVLHAPPNLDVQAAALAVLEAAPLFRRAETATPAPASASDSVVPIKTAASTVTARNSTTGNIDGGRNAGSGKIAAERTHEQDRANSAARAAMVDATLKRLRDIVAARQIEARGHELIWFQPPDPDVPSVEELRQHLMAGDQAAFTDRLLAVIAMVSCELVAAPLRHVIMHTDQLPDAWWDRSFIDLVEGATEVNGSGLIDMYPVRPDRSVVHQLELPSRPQHQ